MTSPAAQHAHECAWRAHIRAPHPQARRSARLWSLGLAPLMVACTVGDYLATPRAVDAPAIQDYAKQACKPVDRCPRRIDIFEVTQFDESAYTAVGTISATCYPGARAVCEQTLKARACELDADVVLIVPSASSAVPPGASGQSLSSLTGRALRAKSRAR